MSAHNCARVAEIVARHWKDSYMTKIDDDWHYGIGTHPLSLVLDALHGETRLDQLGIPEDHPDAALIREAIRHD